MKSIDLIKDTIENQKLRCHRDHIDWQKKLSFYEDEIAFFEKELSLVMQSNATSLSMIEHIQEYQDILSHKKKKLIELQEEVQYQERVFGIHEIVEENISYHLILREKVDQFFEEMEELKPQLKRFAAHND